MHFAQVILWLTGFFINSLLACGSSTAALSMMFFIPCSSFNKGFLFFFSSSSIAAYSSNAAKNRFPSRLLNIFRCSTKMFYQRQRRCKQQGRGQQHSILKILEPLLCKNTLTVNDFFCWSKRLELCNVSANAVTSRLFQFMNLE